MDRASDSRPGNGRSANGVKAPVLVIDDESSVLASLRRLLQREFHVLTAHSATEGLNVLRQQEVQVILTDQRMPGITGVDFLRDIKNRYPDAVRLLFTGYADLESVIQAINAGNIYRYLVKPWNPDELVATIREAHERYELIVARRKLMDQLQVMNAELEKRVEERTNELARANTQLLELNRMKDDFIAITSHDLRSPLTAILGAAELLREVAWESPAARRDLLDMIADAGRRMLELVTNLLELARLEAGGVELKLSSVTLDLLLAECVATLAPVARIKGVGCMFLPGYQVPEIQADNARLYQVFNNLLNNALKFTSAGGQITVTTRRDGPAWVRVDVADTGQGISPEDLPRLFERFKQTRTKATQGEQGAGLGLAIVRQLVMLHHGEITVQSQPGVGTTFSVRLPTAPIMPTVD